MLRETFGFIGRHWLHLLLFVPGAIAVTILHEAAHALAVLAQGGTVNQFVWLPAADKWGFVSYEFPSGVTYSDFAISFAPYLLWLLLAALAFTLSRRRERTSYWIASFVYLWLFVVPLGDIANTAFPYLAGAHNDFTFAFGPPSLLAALSTAAAGLFSIVAGYYVQRGLYREHRLSVPSYLVLSTAAIGALAALTVGGILM